MKIVFVKKIRADGTPCPKCADVEQQLQKNNQMQFITDILVADERDPLSPGMIIAKKFNVERAPFFMVDQGSGECLIYTIYLKFVKEILDEKISEQDEIREIMETQQDLDFI